ncbi:MAG: hypothetical protein OXE57_03985 [Alphaproteobacteria bacterium]|nr:hypothetical protein [Alphaproteobacteria bacterium]
MLHRITGRATKCGPSAISAIAGIPTHEAARLIRELFDRQFVNGVFMDELAAALAELGWKPDYALHHRNLRKRRHARRQTTYNTIFADVPCDVRSLTIGRVLNLHPSGTWAIATSNHFIAYSDGFVADSGAWFSRKPKSWSHEDPDHVRVARRKLQEAVRFVRTS